MAPENQRLILLQTAVIATAAIGATIIIMSGGIDLSVGSTIALSTVVIALLLRSGAPPSLAASGGIAAGVLCGLAIGMCIVGRVGWFAAAALAAGAAWFLWERFGAPTSCAAGAGVFLVVGALNRLFIRELPLSPFIVTLAAWGAFRGLAKGLGDNQPVYPDSSGWLPSLMLPGGAGGYLPPAVLIAVAVAILASALMRSTSLGTHALAIGGNEQAASYAGLPIARIKMYVYALGISLAGLAGVMQFSYLTIGDPTTASGYELKIIAAVVIGGASLSGGKGSIAGTLAGALIMTIVENGCTKLGMHNWVQEIVTGGIILGAVALDRARQRRRATP